MKMIRLHAALAAIAAAISLQAGELRVDGLAIQDDESAYDFLRRTCEVPDSSVVQALDGAKSADEIEIVMLRKTIQPPYQRFRFFFVDDEPDANWAHQCRYVFVSEDWTSVTVVDKDWFPFVRDANTGEVVPLEILNAKEDDAAVSSLEAVKDAVYRYANSFEENAISSFKGDRSKSYFVLISGGDTPKGNGIRFWSDTAMFYSTLTKKYGVAKDHIWVFMSDGNSTGADANLAMSSATPVLVDSPKDLDGDGVGDITGSCSREDDMWGYFDEEFFPSLGQTLKSDDQLVIFVTSHGGKDSNNAANAFVSLFGQNYGEYFTDAELQGWLAYIPCPVAVILQSCYSGGFIEEVISAPNRVIATSSKWLETSWGVAGGGAWIGGTVGKTCAYNWWAQPFTAALRGYFTMPWKYNSDEATTSGGYPWVDYAAANADSDNNGLVSIKEAFDYAKAVDTVGDHPQYGENPSGFGESFYLLKQTSGSAYTVRYRKYDGSGETAEEDFACGKTYTLAWLGSELGWSRPNYEFCGWVPWNPDTKPRLCKYDNGQPVKDLAAAGETINLWAGWKSSSSYRVCFHRCAGPDDLTKMNQVILRNKEDSLAWMDSQIGWKREGYTFLGWDESDKASTVKYANGAKVKNLAMNGGTKHLYAVWRANGNFTYKVRFNKYDGSGSTAPELFRFGVEQRLLWMDSQLGWSRDGYEFCGWVPWNPDTKPRLCKYVNGQKVVDLVSSYNGGLPTVNLWAAWKSKSSYRVCFNRNDGTGVKMNQVILRNKEDNLAWMDSQIGWKRDGYVFKGWAESENGAVKYANGAKVKNLAMDGGTKHLYAIWRLAD